MIVYQTKHKTVKGISADHLIELAKENWSKFPCWLKKEFQEDKILIGGSIVQVESKGCRYRASGTDMIFINDKGVCRVMKQEDFLEVYEDPFSTNGGSND